MVNIRVNIRFIGNLERFLVLKLVQSRNEVDSEIIDQSIVLYLKEQGTSCIANAAIEISL
jgi:hypothetical protein